MASNYVLEVSKEGSPIDDALWTTYPNHSMDDHCIIQVQEEGQLLIY